jgi:hypothetical protein
VAGDASGDGFAVGLLNLQVAAQQVAALVRRLRDSNRGNQAQGNMHGMPAAMALL